MKKSEANKEKFPFIIDVRDYISFSTIIKKENHNQIDKESVSFSDYKTENAEKNKSFNLFSYILEG
jgi:hypothetical protein